MLRAPGHPGVPSRDTRVAGTEMVAQMAVTEDPILSVRALEKTYPDGTKALKDVSLDVPRGQLLAVVGLSGAGKSTLLRCVNRLVEPTGGEIVVDGRNVTQANKRELRLIRREIGMIFQHFNLVDRMPTIRNALHGRLGYTSSLRGAIGRFSQAEVNRALEVLSQLGLENETFKRCADLSGGQKQRVGIARALMQGGGLVLADEPIASLDPWSSETIMRTLKEVALSEGITTIVNLHQVEYAREFADRIVGLRKGELYCDVPASEFDDSTARELYFGQVPEPVAQDS
jgi:phosphonate transport system ATP-binding protein